MALKAYFDGSHTNGKSFTLAVAAADELVWAALAADWVSLLSREGASYMHMKEAMRCQDEFAGWTEEKRDWLLDALKTLIQIHEQQSTGRFVAFTTSVDLAAHADISARHWLPSPARMCVRGLFAKIFDWYCRFPDPILDVIELYFDRNEPFMEHLDTDWKSADFRHRYPAWNLVRRIEPVEMKKTPAIQVADMLAWSRNRVEQQTGDKWFALASLIMLAAKGHVSFDRAKLLTYEPFSVM